KAVEVLPATVVREQSDPESVDAGRPRIVAIGGGHGLSTLLRGLKTHTDDLTAIVTVADDGGSSGMLRQELGLPPPGDLRDCIAALAEAEPLMANLFQYRFGRDTRLDGHSFGNLFIAAMAGITGDFESGVSEASRVLAVRGRILPSSLENVELCAEVRHPDNARGDENARGNENARGGEGERGTLVRGQSRIAAAGGDVERVFLQPEGVKGYPGAIRALLRAELIVMGPGSLYTSVLPNLLIADIREAVRASDAVRVYVANVATQPGETSGFDLGRHVEALAEHVGEGFCDVVIGNDSIDHTLPPNSRSEMVRPHIVAPDGLRVVLADLVDEELPWRHDAAKLAAVVMDEYRASREGRANVL
ncbi:MAG: YvcK family protein, partial [Chloroflexi bacterium]|nr:YvcK family protein [Chloroflexota bacterium]